MQFRWARVLLLSCTLLCLGCLPHISENLQDQSSQPNDVVIQGTQPVERFVEVEQISLPNCGGTGILTQSLGTQTSVHRRVSIGAEARLGGGVQVGIPEAARVFLESEVEGSYEDEYARANARLDSITMQAAPNTHVIYDIAWIEQSYTAIVNYTLSGVFQEADYNLTLQVPRVTESREGICPGEERTQPLSSPSTNNNLDCSYFDTLLASTDLLQYIYIPHESDRLAGAQIRVIVDLAVPAGWIVQRGLGDEYGPLSLPVGTVASVYSPESCRPLR